MEPAEASQLFARIKQFVRDKEINIVIPNARILSHAIAPGCHIADRIIIVEYVDRYNPSDLKVIPQKKRILKERKDA